jgi:DNA anti-recombination protein RmuC
MTVDHTEQLRIVRTALGDADSEAAVLRAELREARARNAELIAEAQRTNAHAVQQVNEVANRCQRLEAQVQRVKQVDIHRDEDGREFVLADDLRAALNPRAGA